MLNVDLVWLFEIKETLQTSVSVFNVYINKCKDNEHGGGVMMMGKCTLMQYVTQVDMKTGQIWVQLLCWPRVKLGEVVYYISPEDCPYHHPTLLVPRLVNIISSDQIRRSVEISLFNGFQSPLIFIFFLDWVVHRLHHT